MIITCQGPGTLLFLSREELPSPAMEDLLPLICAALSDAGRPAPPAMEIRAFWWAQGAVFLILPGPGPASQKFFPGLS